MISVGLSAFTRLELLASENYVSMQKAVFIAEAGIARAVSDIKYNSSRGVMNDPYDTIADPWYYKGNSNIDGPSVDIEDADQPSYGSDASYAGGSYRLKVVDCAALININCPLPDTDAENDLIRILEEFGLSNGQASNLVGFRKTLFGAVFTTKEEVKLVTGINTDDYDLIKDFITLYGDDDDGIIDIDKSTQTAVSGHSRKSYVNVNTAPLEVLRAVLRPMMSNNAQANSLASAIKTRRESNPFDGIDPDADVYNFLSARGEFERFIEYEATVLGISSSDKKAVLSQSDPNIYETNSTKFGFDANGYYEIECLGNYRSAIKRVKETVFVFRKIIQTTKDEFSANSNDITRRISWKDSCPVDFAKLKTYLYADDSGDDPDTDDYIYDSLKLGFWDNFSEDYDPSSPTPDLSEN